jgi:hypothetical protein
MRADGKPVNTFQRWSTILGIGMVAALQVAGFAYIRAAQPDNGGRVVLCTGILANTANTARDDPVVIEVCRQVGVLRENYPETQSPNK